MKALPPLVSIVVPCYNYAHLLSDALDAVLEQTYQHWECIIVNDGSSDHTEFVANTYLQKDKRFKYIYQANAGLSEARNTGIKHAQGKYLQLLDADDMLDTQKLALHCCYLEIHPEIDLVYGDAILFEHDNPSHKKRFQFQVQPVSGQFYTILSALVTDNFFLPGCPLFKMTMIEEVGYFDKSLLALEDWHFWFRCALLGKKFQYVNTSGTSLLSRSHGFNMSTDRKRMWFYKASARRSIMNYSSQLIKGNPDTGMLSVVKKLKLKHKQYLYLDLLRFHMMFGNVWQGIGATLQYAIHSRKYYFALYDAAYWMKERLKLKLSV